MATDKTDADDLEALFDSIAGTIPVASTEPVAVQSPQPVAAASPSSANTTQVDGVAKSLLEAVSAVGQDQLRQAEQLVSKVRSSIEQAKSASDSIESAAHQLSLRWQQLMEGKISVDEFKTLAGETRSFLQDIPSKTKSISGQLSDAVALSDTLPAKKLGELARQIDQVKAALGN